MQFVCEPRIIHDPRSDHAGYVGYPNYESWNYYQITHLSSPRDTDWIVCGFKKMDKPVSFYMSIFALIYCGILTVTFLTWVNNHTWKYHRILRRPRQPQVVSQV